VSGYFACNISGKTAHVYTVAVIYVFTGSTLDEDLSAVGFIQGGYITTYRSEKHGLSELRNIRFCLQVHWPGTDMTCFCRASGDLTVPWTSSRQNFNIWILLLPFFPSPSRWQIFNMSSNLSTTQFLAEQR